MKKRGRPRVYGEQIRTWFARLIENHGLTHAQYVIQEKGSYANQNVKNVSLVTLSNVAREFGITLERGRPTKDFYEAA